MAMSETPQRPQRPPSTGEEARRADGAATTTVPPIPANRIPQPGDFAPDVTLRDADGAEGLLSDLWTRTPRGLVLIFLRHFGCPFCREQATQLRRDYDRFGAAGLHLVAVGQGTPEEGARFQRRLKLPYPILVDTDRAAYAAYGLREGTAGEMSGPAVGIAFFRSLLRGHLPGSWRVGAGGSVMQLHGEFLIDREGILRYAVRPTRPSDIPTTDNLLAAARELV